MGVFTDLTPDAGGDSRLVLQEALDCGPAAAPDAVEDLSYGTPALRGWGRPLVDLRVSAGHLSLFPFSAEVVGAVARDLGGFPLSKGTIRFTAERPPPRATLDRIIARKTEIERAR